MKREECPILDVIYVRDDNLILISSNRERVRLSEREVKGDPARCPNTRVPATRGQTGGSELGVYQGLQQHLPLQSAGWIRAEGASRHNTPGKVENQGDLLCSGASSPPSV